MISTSSSGLWIHPRFTQKDLDEDAEEFIVSWVDEYPICDPIILVTHLSRYSASSDPQSYRESRAQPFCLQGQVESVGT